MDFELLTVLQDISEMSPSLEYWINYPSKCHISCVLLQMLPHKYRSQTRELEGIYVKVSKDKLNSVDSSFGPFVKFMVEEFDAWWPL